MLDYCWPGCSPFIFIDGQEGLRSFKSRQIPLIKMSSKEDHNVEWQIKFCSLGAATEKA